MSSNSAYLSKVSQISCCRKAFRNFGTYLHKEVRGFDNSKYVRQQTYSSSDI